MVVVGEGLELHLVEDAAAVCRCCSEGVLVSPQVKGDRRIVADVMGKTKADIASSVVLDHSNVSDIDRDARQVRDVAGSSDWAILRDYLKLPKDMPSPQEQEKQHIKARALIFG